MQSITLGSTFTNDKVESSIRVEFSTDATIQSSILYDGRLGSSINEAIEIIKKGFLRLTENTVEPQEETPTDIPSEPIPTTQSIPEVIPITAEITDLDYLFKNPTKIYEFNRFDARVFDIYLESRKTFLRIAADPKKLKHVARCLHIPSITYCQSYLKNFCTIFHGESYEIIMKEMLIHQPLMKEFIERGTNGWIMSEMFYRSTEIDFLIKECGLMTKAIDTRVFEIICEKSLPKRVLRLISNFKSQISPVNSENAETLKKLTEIIRNYRLGGESIKNLYLEALV